MSIWAVSGVIIGALIGTGIIVWMDIIIHVTIGIFKRISAKMRFQKRNLKMQCGGIEKCVHIAKNENH